MVKVFRDLKRWCEAGARDIRGLFDDLRNEDETAPSSHSRLPQPSRKVAQVAIVVLVAAIVLFATLIGVLVPKGNNRQSSSSLREGATKAPVPATTAPSEFLAVPTLAPTASSRPSISYAPTTFTKVPTETPSIPPAAKGSPLNLPTQPPTFGPTVKSTNEAFSQPPDLQPTAAPFSGELTSMPFAPPPTYPPMVFPEFDESMTFRLRMYWEQGFHWQEKDRERYWCVECAKCRTLNFSDNGGGCEFADSCEVGHQLWLHGCRKGYGHNFQARTVGDFHQIRVAGTELCVGRYLRRYLVIQTCNTYNRNLMWQKIRADGGPFDLKPADGSRDPEPFCVTQQHHPKPYEILGVKECDLAHLWETGYWMTYPVWEGPLPTQ